MKDTRFATALQIVLSVAVHEEAGVRCTSTDLAETLDAHPTFVRKALLLLAEDGIVVSSAGRTGGIQLGRSPKRITFEDIYRAAVTEKKVWAIREDIKERCVISANIGTYFDMITHEADAALFGVLSKRTVASAVKEFQTLDKLRRSSVVEADIPE